MKDMHHGLAFIPSISTTAAYFHRRVSVGSVPTRCPIKIYTAASVGNQDDTSSEKAWSLSEIANLGDVCSQFTIQVCTSSTCSNRRRTMGQDDGFLVKALYERMESAGAQGLQIEESNCLGQCKKGPCVSVEHDEFEGPVALEGMNPMEFNRKW
jgi:hypothetical protein